jgi:hypothetical protein
MERMPGVVTIPFDYELLPESEQNRLVPICIARLDKDGQEIAWGWFEAVSEIQDPLRELVRCVVGDVHRTSEVVDWSVHCLWRKHRNCLGYSPSGRVYATSRWRAKDLRAGGEGERTRRRLTIAMADLSENVRETALIDPVDHEAAYNNEILFAEFERQFRMRGLHDVAEMLDLVRDGRNWKEIAAQLNCDPNTAQRRFRRWRDRLAEWCELRQANARGFLSKVS